ncbi:hypothetical protein VTK73DRAFT_7915 [Phialemonium thermophilum]|uniref:F-box domain-containing protein n=1 Tax=Phialemonium thermophilum TaxID=223376 RepID=A0ABR3WBP8_9PEZI
MATPHAGQPDTSSSSPPSSSFSSSSPLRAAAPTGLQHLPNELIQAIATYLVPAPPSTTRFLLRPDGTWAFRDADAQWFEWKSGHRDLQSFVATSRRMRAAAASYQFRNVVIHSGTVLVRLFRLLLEQPALKRHVQTLACLVNLLDADVIRDAKHEWASQLARGFRIPWDVVSLHAPLLTPLPSRPSPRERSSADPGIAIALFHFLVGYADSLTDLLLAYPDQGALRLVVPLSHFLWDAPDLVPAKFAAAAPQVPEFRLFPSRLSLQRLSSLRFYCHREEHERESTFTTTFAQYIVSILPDLPRLRTLEVCCDSAAVWSWILGEFGEIALPGLQHLRLYGSRIREPELVALCAACTRLQTLLVHFEEPCDDAFDRPRLPEGRTLNQALLGLSDTLRSLELVALSEGHYLTRGRERPRKPENHRLTCFPALHQLEHLTIDYRGLFGTLGKLEYEDGEAIGSLLPNSLRTFTLICEWGNDKDFKQSYLADLKVVLEGVKLLCLSDRQRLSAVSLAIHAWPKTNKYRSKFRKALEQASLTCARAGIQLQTFELLPRYRDEDEASALGPGGEGGSEPAEDGEAEVEEEYEEEQEDSEYYFSGDDEGDVERDARRPATFEEFVRLLGEDHGHDVDELYYAYHEDRWDEYLFDD